MLKIALPITLVAVVAGTFILAGSPATTAAPASAAGAARAATAKPPATAPATPLTKPATATPTARASTTAAPPAPSRVVHPPPQLADEKASIPDCAAVARHLSEEGLKKIPYEKQIPEEKRQQFIAMSEPSFVDRCVSRHWTDDQRVCLMSATDGASQMACTQDAIATADEVAKLPPELQCDAIAKRTADLALAPGAKFDVMIKKAAARGIKFDPAKVTEQVRRQVREECDGVPWPVEIRRCKAQSKTLQENQSCW